MASDSSSSSNIYREDEVSLLRSYRGVISENFQGAKAFKRCCIDSEQRFVEGTTICNGYILFTGVRLQDMKIVERARKSLPKMSCLSDATEEVLIVKIKLGIAHRGASHQFSLVFGDKLKDLGLRWDLISTGCATFGDGRRQFEADQSFKPLQTRPSLDAWPSLTFEVGFAQSLPQLRNDARFWLTWSQLQTNIVIVIHIDKVQKMAEIERWEVINFQCAHRTTVQYPPTIGCVQRIELKEGDVYTGPPLELAVDKLFDIVPPGLAAGALDLTAPELQSWNLMFWKVYT